MSPPSKIEDMTTTDTSSNPSHPPGSALGKMTNGVSESRLTNGTNKTNDTTTKKAEEKEKEKEVATAGTNRIINETEAQSNGRTGTAGDGTSNSSSEKLPQYDLIGAKYEAWRDTNPATLIEVANLRTALEPYIKGAKVLDLACGTGYFSRKVLEWGADRVLGYDLSSEMINVANHLSKHRLDGDARDRVQFRVGDASKLGRVSWNLNNHLLSAGQQQLIDSKEEQEEDEGEFDIVLGVWLLNYASCKAELAAMFSTISKNLKKGGGGGGRGHHQPVFVGITSAPIPLAELTADEWKEKVEGKDKAVWGVGLKCLDRAPQGEGDEGWKVEIQGEGISFQTYILGREVYDDAAREGGMDGGGGLEWKEVEMMPVKEDADKVGDEKFWEEYFETGPHMGLVVARKKGAEGQE